MDTKVCSRCKLEKPLAEFSIRKSSGRPQSQCKLCVIQGARARDALRKDEVREVRRRYRQSHQAEINQQRRERMTKETPEEKALRRKKATDQRHRRREVVAQQYVVRGEVPKCACGCGQKVGFDKDGHPYEFLRNHHQRLRQVERPVIEYMDHAVVEAILRRYRDAHKLTWPQVAERAGVRLTVLWGYVQSSGHPNRHRTDRVIPILQRLAGAASQPTEYELETWRRPRIVELPGGDKVARYG